MNNDFCEVESDSGDWVLEFGVVSGPLPSEFLRDIHLSLSFKRELRYKNLKQVAMLKRVLLVFFLF